ncbi:hypothetical protein JCM10020v2_000304 [Rhodotorula toruloides]
MARTHSQYPRSTLRTILRSHASSSSAHTLSPNSDAIAFVAHLAFLRKLAREVKELVEEEKGRKEKKRVEAADLRRASKDSLLSVTNRVKGKQIEPSRAALTRSIDVHWAQSAYQD